MKKSVVYEEIRENIEGLMIKLNVAEYELNRYLTSILKDTKLQNKINYSLCKELQGALQAAGAIRRNIVVQLYNDLITKFMTYRNKYNEFDVSHDLDVECDLTEDEIELENKINAIREQLRLICNMYLASLPSLQKEHQMKSTVPQIIILMCNHMFDVMHEYLNKERFFELSCFLSEIFTPVYRSFIQSNNRKLYKELCILDDLIEQVQI